MAEGRSRADWGHTSSILAMTANVHRDPKKTPLKPSRFNPHLLRTKRRKSNVTVARLADEIMGTFEAKERKAKGARPGMSDKATSGELS